MPHGDLYDSSYTDDNLLSFIIRYNRFISVKCYIKNCIQNFIYITNKLQI